MDAWDAFPRLDEFFMRGGVRFHFLISRVAFPRDQETTLSVWQENPGLMRVGPMLSRRGGVK
jgi:hypothetical protein